MSIYPVPLSGTDNTLMWADEAGIEEQARAQLRNVAGLEWTHGVRVMPDVHYGLGATVGSVIAMEQAVAPAAVGVDIGCGMTAVRTNLRPDQLPDDLAAIRRGIERAVPVGFSSHSDEPRTVGRHDHPGFAHDRLKQHHRGVGINRGPQRVDVAVRHMRYVTG